MSETVLKTPSINTIVKKIRTKTREALSAKTGWGRNEIITLLDEALNDAVAETLDELVTVTTPEMKK